MRFAQTLFIIACLAVVTFAEVGGDVFGVISQADFECAKKNGWSFMMVRSYHSYGAPDTAAPTTLANAAAAGISNRGIYHFPCAQKDPGQQVKDDLNAVNGNFNTIWFDIETNPSTGCGWGTDKAANCEFLLAMIQAAKEAGASPGVYSSSYMWTSIMGDQCTVGADNDADLWYAHYDDLQTFSDFKPFGGWTSPKIKQYNDKVSIPCGFNADADFKHWW